MERIHKLLFKLLLAITYFAKISIIYIFVGTKYTYLCAYVVSFFRIQNHIPERLDL
jgi:hypothetical protein